MSVGIQARQKPEKGAPEENRIGSFGHSSTAILFTQLVEERREARKGR
jgi:hypothetical protein